MAVAASTPTFVQQKNGMLLPYESPLYLPCISRVSPLDLPYHAHLRAAEERLTICLTMPIMA